MCGLQSRSVHIWDMYVMVMDETQHVFPGGRMGQGLCVCQQEAFAMCCLGHCPADDFQLECVLLPSSPFSACWARCRCRACVTAPRMLASMVRGSLNRWMVAWCWRPRNSQSWCCCRVSAADQPTSVSLHAWRGYVLKCSKLSGLVWSHTQWVCSSGMWLYLRASHWATLVRSGSCSLRSWMPPFCRWAGMHAGRSPELYRGMCRGSWSS